MAEQVKLFVILSSITGTHVVERKEKLLQADPHMNSVAHVPQHIYKINKCKNNWEPCSPCSLPLRPSQLPRLPQVPMGSPFHPLHTWTCAQPCRTGEAPTISVPGPQHTAENQKLWKLQIVQFHQWDLLLGTKTDFFSVAY